MRTFPGSAYRFGTRECASFDEVIGARPCQLEVHDGVEIKKVTHHVAIVDGKKVSMAWLIAEGKVRVVEQPKPEKPKAEKKPKAPAKRAPKKKSKKAVLQ